MEEERYLKTYLLTNEIRTFMFFSPTFMQNLPSTCLEMISIFVVQLPYITKPDVVEISAMKLA